jgi:hypothetical protein
MEDRVLSDGRLIATVEGILAALDRPVTGREIAKLVANTAHGPVDERELERVLGSRPDRFDEVPRLWRLIRPTWQRVPLAAPISDPDPDPVGISPPALAHEPVVIPIALPDEVLVVVAAQALIKDDAVDMPFELSSPDVHEELDLARRRQQLEAMTDHQPRSEHVDDGIYKGSKLAGLTDDTKELFQKQREKMPNYRDQDVS